ncbi:MAG: accessory factor UbiK family protein [Alphaproteobacteria bacterium]|nr:accessory factor UbiK family protein [Alphaproteobacteria bacterium]
MTIRDEKASLLDDIARMAGGAASLLGALRAQIREEVRARVDETAQRLDLVPREDHEQLAEMVAQMRLEQDALRRQLDQFTEDRKQNKENGQ